MTSKAMWEVDPETRSKLLDIQKTNSNNTCCDCLAPSPQWASPKFGIFICLSCAGIHRGLGVHISFVRSITMDAFKNAEIERMRSGGNAPWREFFDTHAENKLADVKWDDVTVAERYSGIVGEEWKERLSAKVEGVEYVPGAKSTSAPAPRTSTPSNSAQSAVPTVASNAAAAESRKAKVDDKYFGRLGAANASRSADLPPSQGGKYAGFGSGGAEVNMGAGNNGGGIGVGFEDLQKDPVAALTKGFGWFTATVAKTTKQVNESYIQPTAQRLAEADIAKQAQLAAAQVARTAQAGARGASDGFNRFVEGGEGSGRRTAPIDESKRDFWDSFGKADEETSSIGTSALKGSSSSSASTNKKKEEWDDW